MTARSGRDSRRDVTSDSGSGVTANSDFFRILVENISDVVSVSKRDGTISWVSPSVVSLLGYSADEIVGQPLINYMVAEDIPTLSANYENTLRGDTVHFEVRLIQRDQSTRWIALAAHWVDIPGDDGVRIATWR
ncbi:MAG: PAS domain-containing protein, partial [Actinomycetota bacterium]|nr:PAS domain-containing protein [Actinomycetota bacterium]